MAKVSITSPRDAMVPKHGMYATFVQSQTSTSIFAHNYHQDYWSLLDGDEYGTWVDARLTDVGISQAKTAHDAWAKQIKQKIPPPQSYYVSPLNRCCQTAQVTFEGLDMPLTSPFRPVIKEVRRRHCSAETVVIDLYGIWKTNSQTAPTRNHGRTHL
jgi:Fructose-2,6-bisphosphatase